MLTGLGSAATLVDRRGRPVLSNDAYERLARVHGSPLRWLSQEGRPLSPSAMPLRRAARGESADLILQLARGEGESEICLVTVRPLQLPGRPEVVGIVTLRDLERRTLQLIEDRFAAVVGHELRTPLSALQSYADLLESYLPAELTSAEARAAVERIHHLTARLNVLVGGLFELARLSGGTPSTAQESVVLEDVVRDAVEIAASAPEMLPVRVAASETGIAVLGRAPCLSTVFLNLLTNAMRHAAGATGVEVQIGLDGDQALVVVADDGAGIAADDLPRIFERHYRGRRHDAGAQRGAATQPDDGQGLGLYLCREIVAAHGGRIDVASAVGHGTRFSVRLPRVRIDTSPR